MAIQIHFDSSCIPETPTFVLAKRNGTFIGEILAEEIIVKDSLNDTSEISFKVRKYLDCNKNTLWDSISDFKLVWCKEWDMWFEVTVELEESDETIKSISGTNLCIAELSQIMIYNTEINTEDDIARDDYVSPTVFYDNENPGCSLLNRMMEKAYAYSIEHVDNTLKKIQRTFSFDKKSVYDALREVEEEIGCLFIFKANTNSDGSINRSISVYDLEQTCNQCGYRGDFTDVCPKCKSADITSGYGKDTTIFVEYGDLTDEITLSTDSDSTKTCFKLIAGDDLMTATIRNCNPNSSDYLWRIPQYMKEDMSDELQTKLDEYNELYEEYTTTFDFNQAGIPDELITKHDALVEKYKTYCTNLETLASQVPIIGYSSLMKLYYNVIDFSLLLQSEMMPNVELMDTTAEEQLEVIEAITNISVSYLFGITLTTVENSLSSMIQCVIDNRYKAELLESVLQEDQGIYSWNGKVKVINSYNEEDATTSDTISILINENYKEYVQQKIERALHKKEVNYNIQLRELFKLDLEAFKEELNKYCLDSLNNIKSCCQGCIDILTEQGISNPNNTSWGNIGDDNNLYNNLYLPYYNKMVAIDSGIQERSNDLSILIGSENAGVVSGSDGVQQYLSAKIQSVQNELKLENFLGANLLKEFSCYRREDEYQNDNYISDGLTTKELFQNANSFLEAAQKEIYKSSEKQYSISSDLKNFLLVEKFKPIVDYFEVGNWIRYRVDGEIYKLRIIEYQIKYDKIEQIELELSNVLKIADGISDQQSIMKQISTMATSYDAVVKQAEKGASGNQKIENVEKDGIYLNTIQLIGDADNQNISWDSNGFLCRKYDDDTETYLDDQLKIINNGLYITNDNWETTKAALGYYIYTDTDGKANSVYGLNAETIVGRLLIGEQLNIYNNDSEESSSLKFDKNGLTVLGTNNQVYINPNSDESIFIIKSKDQDTGSFSNIFSFDDTGKLIVTGEIHATKFVLVNNNDNPDDKTIPSDYINGLASVATTGDYNSLLNTPELASVAISGSYNDLSDTPALATVATTGDYNDLDNVPDLTTKMDTPVNNSTATANQVLVKSSGGSTWKSLSQSVTNSTTGIPTEQAVRNYVQDYAVKKNQGTSLANTILYVNENGEVSTITISELKTLLGI